MTMKMSSYWKTIEGMAFENKYSRILIFGLIGLAMLLCVALIRKDTAVVVMPPGLTEKGEIAPASASRSVKVAWGNYIATMLGNVQPTTAKLIAESMGPILAPDIYQNVMDSIEDQARLVREEQISTQFSPATVEYDERSDKVIVSGQLVMRGLRQAEKRSQRTYELGFAVNNYNVVLSSLRVMDGAWRPETP